MFILIMFIVIFLLSTDYLHLHYYLSQLQADWCSDSNIGLLYCNLKIEIILYENCLNCSILSLYLFDTLKIHYIFKYNVLPFRWFSSELVILKYLKYSSVFIAHNVFIRKKHIFSWYVIFLKRFSCIALFLSCRWS